MATLLIFVRQKQDLKFLDVEGGWTGSLETARKFESTWQAVDACGKQNVHESEIVMRFGAPLYDVVIDVV